jgi:two-component system, NtrC family, response regulator AtoC
MLANANILVVDDEKNGRRMLEILLSKLGYQVLTANDGNQALEVFKHNEINLLISDLKMPNLDGIGLLNELRSQTNEVPVILLTAFGSVNTAVSAMKLGAYDFIERPYNIDHIELIIKNALETSRLKQENQFLREQLQGQGWDEFIGQSEGMRELYNLIKQIAPSKANVFISGETGTGKELVARAIHRHSGRSGLFVPINCAAIPNSILESELFGYVRGAFTGADKDRIGKFELANNGTLFLDEITEMNIDIQAKLLRVLQESKIERLGSNHSVDIDIRIVAATNRFPSKAMEEGRLREDLFYRLNVISAHLPPLRERKEDIVLLALHFIEKYSQAMGISEPQLTDDAVDKLKAYHWPGNVRELENILERAVVLNMDGKINEEHIPQATGFTERRKNFKVQQVYSNLEEGVSDLEIRMISNALEKAEGNKAKAARQLEISERTLWYKLKKYNIKSANDEK